MFVFDNDIYLDITSVLTNCNGIGKSNVANRKVWKKKVFEHDAHIKEVLRLCKVSFGPLLPTNSTEKLVSVDLGLLDDNTNASLRSKLFLAIPNDSKKKKRSRSWNVWKRAWLKKTTTKNVTSTAHLPFW